MRYRWRLILPSFFLALFILGAFQGVIFQRRISETHPSLYFYWAFIRLDSDPLNRSGSESIKPCQSDQENCVSFDGPTWVEPGVGARIYYVLAFPAIFTGMAIVRHLGHFGISEKITFFALIPPLLFAWFYLVGFLTDKWYEKRLTKHPLL